MHLSKEELHRIEQADLKTCVSDELTDIYEIEIDEKKSVSARVEEYIQEVGNPFLVRVGTYTVKIGYADCQETLNDRMWQYLRKVMERKDKSEPGVRQNGNEYL